jgi:tetratricopeptide (TPR) repeat protein
MFQSPRAIRGRPAFWALALLLTFAALELGSRVIERVENAVARRSNPYVEAVNPVPAFQVVDEGGTKMVRRSGFHPLMARDHPIPLQRPPGGLRVFVLGGSAAAGWPFDQLDTNLSALLERELQALYPGRSIEVVNMAAGTYASHRVKLILEEVIRYQPDAIFLYNGNNEFVENLVFRPHHPPAPFEHSAAARLIYRVATSLAFELPRIDVKGYSIDAQATTQLSFAFGKASRYREDPVQFEALLNHYRYNIESMVATARAAKVPLFLVTCPVNLKDWTPNVSRHRADLSPVDLVRWTSHFRQGYLAGEQGNFAGVIAPMRAALALDDEYAEAHFLLGRALLETGDRFAAKAEFLRALERDAFPFRELPEFQAILRETATRHRVPLVDIIPPLEAAAADGIPGLDVFIDYVHLTEKSQEIVAHELLRALRVQGLAQGVSDGDLERVRISVEHRFVPNVEVFAADVNYNMALVMHQYGRLDALYERAVQVFRRAAAEEPSLASDCATREGLFGVVQSVIGPYRELLRAQKLGLAEQLFTPAETERITARYGELLYQTRGARLSREEFLRRFPPEIPAGGR